jgi:hypothetical protein
LLQLLNLNPKSRKQREDFGDAELGASQAIQCRIDRVAAGAAEVGFGEVRILERAVFERRIAEVRFAKIGVGEVDVL